MSKIAGKRYTIKDIADMAGVSPATVSRVFSGTPGVNPEKRQEIKDLIKKTGYHPSSVARSLVRGKTNVVGLIVRDLENQYYSSMAVAFQKELAKIDYIPMVMSMNAVADEMGGGNRLSELIGLFDFAGLFITVSAKESVLEEALRECSCPVVLLNRTFNIECDQVVQNDYRAGAIVAEHLLDLGHRNFLVLGDFKTSISQRFRVEGFQQTLAAAGVSLSRENKLECPMERTEAYKTAKVFFERRKGELPTAGFIVSNNMALGFLQACSEAGVRVPDDISVVSGDNPPIMSQPGIDLTTISISLESMASEAVKMLKRRIDGKGTENDLVVLQPELIVRGSSIEAADQKRQKYGRKK
ncbi:MAG TPA: LacI family transcriptional regulator [Candidatus Mediterraneibacter norfolkensis]|nr:LacI family transcriptional regulator [Candidatus Mediterraneibacter norfolkensis]